MKHKLIVPLILLSVLELYAGKRAFTIEDLYRVKYLGDPQFSPDGRKIAFTVTEYMLEEGKSNSDIYVINTEGDGLRRMTHDTAADFHPRWSPDGRSLLFVSYREDGAQVWQIAVDGGEAKKLTDFSPCVIDPEWSPDGLHIIFYSRIFPECGAVDSCNRAVDDRLKEGTIQAHMADALLFRHWDIWKDGRRLHTIAFSIEDKKYTDLTPGDRDLPAFLTGGGSAGYAVGPDGSEVCIAATADSNEWESTNKDLFLIPLNGGEKVNITSENPAYDAHPVYSPDGRYIAYLTQKVPGYESDLMRLAIYDRLTRTNTVLTDHFDYWIESVEWAHDSKNIFFTAAVRGHVALYHINLKNKKIQSVLDIKTIDAFSLSHDGKSVVMLRRSVGDPTELWISGINGKNPKALTSFNAEIQKEVDIRPAEEMWIDSPTGRKIHTFIVKPHDFDPHKKYPLILNVHGGPQMQWIDSFRGDWQVYPGSGYIVAFPNPHGSTGYGQDFTRAISRDYAGKVYTDVMAVTDSLARLPWVDDDRMGAMGWSYGGYMMMWMEGHTESFKAIAAMMGIYNLTSFYGTTEELWFPHYDLGGTPWDSDDYEKWSPRQAVKNFKTPCLVMTGEKDFRVSYTQSLEFFTALQKMGVPSRLIVFKDDGHWPDFVKSMPLYYNAHLDWFHKYLGGEPAPYDIKEMIRNNVF